MIVNDLLVLQGATTPPRAMVFVVENIAVFGETVPGHPEKGTLIELYNKEQYAVRETVSEIIDRLTRERP